MNHTPEPWYEGKNMDWDAELPRADYIRAAKCVNAMAGIEDPEYLMKRMLDALKSIESDVREFREVKQRTIFKMAKTLDLFPKESETE